MNRFSKAQAYLIANGAHREKHSGLTLLEHLSGTYKLLEQWNCSEDVCIAGLCHSIYGTEVFKHSILHKKQRAELKQIIGENAEYLSYLFCIHKRRSLWFNLVNVRRIGYFSIKNRYNDEDIKIDEQTFAALAVISLANKLEQRAREPLAIQSHLKREMLATKRLLPHKAWDAFTMAYDIQ